MSILKHLLALAVLFPSVAMAAETIAQPIKHYRLDAASNYLYAVGANSWGSAACPNAPYATILPGLVGHKLMFAAIASAHAAGKTVRFVGECSSDPNYFNATYIIVE